MVLAHDASCFIDYFGAAFEAIHPVVTPNWHFGYLSDEVIPALREAGVTEAQVDQMLVANPQRYFGGSRP